MTTTSPAPLQTDTDLVTDSGSPSRPRRKIPLPILIAVVVLIVAELVVRVAAPSLAYPLTWGDWETQSKVDAIDALARQGGASTVFVGSSMMNIDFDPNQFSDEVGSRRPAFNAALNGSDPRSIEPWLLDVVEPRLRPDTVVIGLSSRDLNDNGKNQKSFYQAFTGSPRGSEAAGTQSLMQEMDSTGSDVSYLFRYRTVLRNPARMFKERLGPPEDHVDRLGVLKATPGKLEGDYANSPEFKVNQRDSVLNNYVIGRNETSALDRMIDTLQDRGKRVVLVKMPVTDDVVALHPHGAKDYERFNAALDRLAARHEVELIDAAAEINDSSLFTDPYHLNREGREQFTALIADAIGRP